MSTPAHRRTLSPFLSSRASSRALAGVRRPVLGARLANAVAASALCIATAAMAAGCSAPVEDDAPASDDTSSDLVSAARFDTAAGIVRGIDYLPFHYAVDGCYARALYMSMELAAAGIESNAIFAFAKPDTSLVVGDIQWGYHVAPMLEVGSTRATARWMVLDPSLSASPLTEQAWLSKMGKGPGTPASDAPTILVVPGSDYAPDGARADTSHRNLDTADFHHLPPFKTSDIQNACLVMHRYMEREPGQWPWQIWSKQGKLLERTEKLIAGLRHAGKLREDATFRRNGCRL